MSNCNRTPERIVAFCAALAESCNVGRACKAIGFSRSAAYAWREQDEQFAKAWDAAKKIGVSALEDEAHRRAFDGNEEPLTHQGKFMYLREAGTNKIVRDEDGKPRVATIKKYSDTLAIFLLKAHDPEKHRDNSKVELGGKLDILTMSEEEIRAELAALLAQGIVPGAPSDGDKPD